MLTLSDATQLMLGITIITVPTIAFGGYFLLTQLIHPTIIRTSKQAAYFRAGHAHAGVLVILSLIGQLIVENAFATTPVQWAIRIGLVAAPLLISGGFFGAGATIRADSDKPGRLVVLIYAGALALAASMIALGLGLVVNN